ncbi:hypothetical protein CONPUDRAFT_158399 [Coniophora puteana RWD-64-598 SS2]|uniref:Uncharacterized protein n=1 Tax=Coniophora puteana (strain RWD-64-598) TaxID=741705 RepID=A0A5M3MBC0_CONPW|nr:uncharacterized protein CONPUDRAFT_158399 [Coniophora puteana RWD-64-598 SS2]EIW76373.1 hypothetical protein CONPUDRAFT_158399 [Coniophora puteana RWD-64-598 SS2]
MTVPVASTVSSKSLKRAEARPDENTREMGKAAYAAVAARRRGGSGGAHTFNWTGSTRILYSLDEPPYGRLAAVEVAYDEEIQTTNIIRAPNLGVESGVQEHFRWHGTELQAFETEPY